MFCREFEEAGISLNPVDFKQLIISALKRLHGEVCHFFLNYFWGNLNPLQLLIYVQYIQKEVIGMETVIFLIEISVLRRLLLAVFVHRAELGFRLLINWFFAYQPLSVIS